MEILNKMNKIELDGLEFESIQDEVFCPNKNYREYEEGKRTKVKEIYLDRLIKEESGAICLWRYRLTMTNRGACELEGKPLKGDDAERARLIFHTIKIVK